jgi:hypothetical protein
MEEKLPQALPRDVPDYHERQAAHFRALVSTATTARLKTRLLREAEEHEQLARGEPILSSPPANGRWKGLFAWDKDYGGKHAGKIDAHG